jgi:hypothetical protein
MKETKDFRRSKDFLIGEGKKPREASWKREHLN